MDWLLHAENRKKEFNDHRIQHNSHISVGLFVASLCRKWVKKLLNLPFSWIFLVLGFAMRFSEGVGYAFINISSQSVITIEFPDKREEYCGYMETSLGLGMTLGPVLGAIFYRFFGFFWTFICFFFLISTGLINVLLLLPQYINYKQTSYDSPEEEQTALKT